MTIYGRAWELLHHRINEKTGWGKNELGVLMAECLEQAVNEWDQQQAPDPMNEALEMSRRGPVPGVYQGAVPPPPPE